MEIIHSVEWTDQTKLWYGALAVFLVSNMFMEATGLTLIRYSKFRREKGMSTRIGTMIFEGVAVLFALGYATMFAPHATPTQWLMTGLLVAHFGKRFLEALFVHKYSGPIDFLSVFQITGFYCLACWLAQSSTAGTTEPLDSITWVGVGVFVVGIVINGYHHLLLARLRSDGSTGYQIPRGGLFDVIVCPHYLGELLIWLGIAIVSRQLLMYIFFAGELGYLGIRTRKTLAWYRSKFPDFPRRSGLVPGIA